MKINKLIFVCLLLAILTVGAVSASDNVTEEVSLEGEVVTDAPIEDVDEVSQSDENALEKSNWDMDVDDTVDVLPAENQKIRIDNCPEDAEGNFSLTIDEVNKECAKEGNSLIFDASNLTLGEHKYSLNFLGDEKYAPAEKSGILNVSEAIFNFPASWQPYIPLRGTSDIYVDVNCLDGELFYSVDGSKFRSVNYYDDKIGDIYRYCVDVGLLYNNVLELPKRVNITLMYKNGSKVIEKSCLINCTPYILCGDTFELYSDNYKNLKLIAEINGKTYDLKYRVTGEDMDLWYYFIDTSSLEPGNYTAKLTYLDDKENSDLNNEINFSVLMNEIVTNPITVCSEYYVDFEDECIEIHSVVPEGLNCKLTVFVDGKQFNSTSFTNGIAIIYASILKMGLGEHKIDVELTGDCNYSHNRYIEVIPAFNFPLTVTNGNGEISIDLPETINKGKLIVEIYNKNDKYSFSKKVTNGKASILLNSLNAGKYKVVMKYYDGNKEYGLPSYIDMTVKNSKLTAKDLTKYYGSSTAFKVKVTTAKGKVVKSKYVKFYINGKYVKKVKTNKNGYATLKIGKAPGSYKITAKYGKVQITRKLTVKHVVTLKKVTVKKSAKKLVLKATLKQGKKALKNKKVTFKFNGKTYKAKTNKKGVAKVTIKKAVLKKLKVGKKVTYQATYLKDTVKKTAKVVK